MSNRNLIFLFALIVIGLLSCDRQSEKRKIKLSSEITTTRQDQKINHHHPVGAQRTAINSRHVLSKSNRRSKFAVTAKRLDREFNQILLRIRMGKGSLGLSLFRQMKLIKQNC